MKLTPEDVEMNTTLPPCPQENTSEGYSLDVNEVAQILGVTRTRVSQLTSTGVLSCERRKVGIRNRLFYRRSDVLNYQQSFYVRPVVHNGRNMAFAPSSAQAYSDQLNSESAYPPRAGAFGLQTMEPQRQQAHDDILQTRQRHLGEQSASLESRTTTKRTLRAVRSQQLGSAFTQQIELQKTAAIESIHTAIEGLEQRLIQNQSQFERIISELFTLKKDLNHVAHKARTADNKTSLKPAMPDTEPLPRAQNSRHRLKNSHFRSSVKKRMAP
jgi:predicted transcriptional regulator